MVRIAIVGARRRRQGLGEFLARILKEQGADVCAAVGSTRERAGETSAYLKEKYGIDAEPHADLPTLFSSGRRIDAVAICSPHRFHLEHLKQCAEGGVHALCEKPIVWDDRENPRRSPRLDIEGETKTALSMFRQAGRRLLVNAQWPHTLAPFRELFPDADLARIDTFEMGMCPPAPGIAMIPEAAPHAISFLLALMGPGAIENLKALYEDPAAKSRLILSFAYRHAKGTAVCALRYACTEEYPRPTHVAINGRRMDRVVKLPAYEIGFAGGVKTVWTGDPMARLAADFLKAVAVGPSANPPEEDEKLLLHSRFIAQLADATEKA